MDYISNILKDRLWVVPLVGALITVTAYLAGRSVPAGSSGLYLHMAETIGKHGFGLPETIYGYGRPIPMAYPPLAIYIVAILLKSGLDGLTIALWLPPLTTAAATVPAYFLGEELENKRVGLLFSGFLFFTPTFISLKFRANGLTHGPATLLTLTGLYFAARMYRTQSRRDTVFAGVLFGSVVLTHPRWTLVCVAGYLALSLRRPSVRSLAYGAAAAVVGLLVTTPWLAVVIANHGIDPFLLSSGTRGGMLNPRYLLLIVPTNLTGTASFHLWTLTTIGGMYALATKRWHIAAWPFLGAGIAGTFGGAFPPLVFLSTLLLDDVLLPAITDTEIVPDQQTFSVALVALLLLPGLIWSPMFMANTVPGDRQPIQTPLDESDRDAMTWVSENLPPNTTVAVAQGPTDWFPYLSDRATAVSPFGAEWLGRSYQQQQIHIRSQLKSCSTPECIKDTLNSAGESAKYVYASRSKITVSDVETAQNCTTVYTNDEIIIFRRQ